MKTTAPRPVPIDATPKKRSSVHHTRAIQRDRRQRPTSAPPAEAVVECLTEIVRPAILIQVNLFHALGRRARVFTLPVIVGLVLGLLWRPIGGVAEWVRVVQRETLLWVVRAGIEHPLAGGACPLADTSAPRAPNSEAITDDPLLRSRWKWSAAVCTSW